MKKNIKILLILFLFFFAAGKVSAINLFTGGVDPHDSLLFDGSSLQSIEPVSFGLDPQCFTRVVEVQGNVIGKVLTKEIYSACGENETVYTAVERFLKKGDMLMHGSEVITSVDSKVELAIVLMESTFHRVTLKVGPESQITTPSFIVECKNTLKEREQAPPEEIKVIEGIVTYDAEPDAGFKAKTNGKRSSAKHTKTRYSHEVKIDAADTVDIIRVYKGAVEVSMLKIDIDEGDMTKKFENLGEDMQSGKLSAEEMQAKMSEFQNFGQMVNELMQPLNVDEGFKCTVTKSTRVVEPLGAGDEESK